MHVSWATMASCAGQGVIAYAPVSDAAAVATATATCKLFSTGQTTPVGLWDGVMTGLAPATRYTYTIDGARNFSFVNEPPATPRVYAMYGR